MFIRWKAYKSKSTRHHDRYNSVKTDETYTSMGRTYHRYKQVLKTDEERTSTYAAYLCVSRRIDGKPRQEATYLASYYRDYLSSVIHQARFWELVTKKLDAISLSQEQREKLESALMQRVPRPSPEQVRQAETESNQRMEEARLNLQRLMGRA